MFDIIKEKLSFNKIYSLYFKLISIIFVIMIDLFHKKIYLRVDKS